MVMNEDHIIRIRSLIDRLARINAADEWADDINPSQWTALSYLSRANRFSRTPSQVADYMSATRGTVSQTLKSLLRKGLIEEVRSDADKRRVTYSVTPSGAVLLDRTSLLADVLGDFDAPDLVVIEESLRSLVREMLDRRGNRAFGICKTCKFHRPYQNGGYCELLQETLAAEESGQFGHE